MKVLVVHNAYQQRGGEDAVVDDECRLLAEHGHEVRRYVRHNDELAALPRWRAATQAIWSRRSRADVAALIAQVRPDVLHVHNTHARVSPAVIWAAAQARVAVVATLHNFRLACLEGSLLREGRPCEACVGHLPWRGVVHACYRGARQPSAVLAASTVTHRVLGTWREHVHRFIVLDAASVPRFVAAGLPMGRIRVRPNFAWPLASAPGPAPARSGGLYVGRLAPEKGLRVLAQALQLSPGLPFEVLGEGPERAMLQQAGATLHGERPPAEVQHHMQRAAYLVVPSITQEQFPRVLAEAFAAGLPVLAAAHGPLANLVADHQTGLHCRPGDAADLAAKMTWAQAHPQEMAAMGDLARALHAERYAPEAAHRSLLAIYQEACSLAAQGARA